MSKLSLVFDRRKRAKGGKPGSVEVQVYLNRTKRIYVTVGAAKAADWPKAEEGFATIMEKAEKIVMSLELLGEPVTADGILRRLYPKQTKKTANGAEPGKGAAVEAVPAPVSVEAATAVAELAVATKPKAVKATKPRAKVMTCGVGAVSHHAEPTPKVAETAVAKSKGNFIAFARYRLQLARLAVGTYRHHRSGIDELERSGIIKTFEDLTPENLIKWDDYLRHSNKRVQATVYDYHKRMKVYVRLAYEMGYIDNNPYEKVHFKRGSFKERRPLTAEELERVMSVHLCAHLDRARDLFVFCAHTGLAYADARMFDAGRDVEEINGRSYIDGRRIKTGTSFYTPILAPALAVLDKYGGRLPRLNAIVYNRYLHEIERAVGLRKSLTSHVARHTFATLTLAKGVPIEAVSKMLGHTNIVTTQIYAKVLKTNIIEAAAIM